MSGLRSGMGTKFFSPAARRARRSRPLSRFQEVVMLGVVFALGVGLQLTLILKLAPIVQ